MFRRLRELFSDPNNAPLIVELKGVKRPEPPSKELRDSILTLQFHPGFQWLQANKRFQSAVCEARLREKQESLRDVDRLQAMIAVLNWDVKQLDAEVGRAEAHAKPITENELALFNQISSSIELVK